MAIKPGVSLHFLVISIVVSLLLSTQCETASAGKDKFLIATCGKTQFPWVCYKTLKSDPRSLTANLTGLSRIALELAATKINETTPVAEKLLLNATNFTRWSTRQACLSDYNVSFYKLKDEALPSFDLKKYKHTFGTVSTVTQLILQCSTQPVEQLKATSIRLWRFTTDIKAFLRLL